MMQLTKIGMERELMQDADLAAYFEDLGTTSISEAGRHWFAPYPRLPGYLMAMPFWTEIEVSAGQVEALFQHPGVALVRYIAPQHSGTGAISHLQVARRPYDLQTLQPKARNLTRRGMEQCRVEPISFALLAAEGFDVQQDTARRRGIAVKSRGSFAAMCARMGRFRHWVAWGAFVGDQLAAYLIALQLGTSLAIVEERSSSQFFGQRPNNALVYAFTRWALIESGFELVSFGLSAIESNQSLDHFKRGMGYQQQPVREVVRLHPRLRVIPRLLPGVVWHWMEKGCRRCGWTRLVKVAALGRIARHSLQPGAGG